MSESPSSAAPQLYPDKIGNYRIVRLIGEGGMGRVFEAIDDQIQRRSAIKVLHAQFAHNGEAFSRFLNEARAVNIVQHPGVVNIFEFGQTQDGCPYIVMEYLEGESLSARLERLKFLSLGALRIARQIASALVAAHAKHITHRDLKPSNIMLVPDPDMPGGERVKVVDFGIAKMTGDRQSGQMKTRIGAILGTPLYMSPEQCRGAGEVNEKSDVYSLGVMIYEMLVGRPPFVADGEGEIMAMHQFHVPPPLHTLAPTLPLELVNLVHSMLAKPPEQRPTMVEVARELDRIGQRMSDLTRASAAEVAANASEPKPAGPKTLPFTDVANDAQEAPAVAAAARSAASPTISAPSGKSSPPPIEPPPASASSKTEDSPAAPELETPAVAAAKSHDSKERLTAEVRTPRSSGKWLKLAVPFGLLFIIAGGSSYFGLTRHRSRPASGVRAASSVPTLPEQPIAPRPEKMPAKVAESPSGPPHIEAHPETVPPSSIPAEPQPSSGGPAPSAEPPVAMPKTSKFQRTDDVVGLAEEYVRTGQWISAINLAKVWGENSANPALMRRIVGISACHLKQAGEAQEAYDKLKAEDRKAVALACRIAGVSIPEEVLADAERLLVQKSWTEALAVAQSPQLPRPLPAHAWRIIGIAACQLRDFQRAKEAEGYLSVKDKAVVESICHKTRPEKPVIF